MRCAATTCTVRIEMVARAVEDAGRRLHDLRWEELEDGVVAAGAFALSIAASAVRPELSLPLLCGGLFVAGRAVVTIWRRWDLLDRLLSAPDAYALAEVRRRAEREATMTNRRRLARDIRWLLDRGEDPRVLANAEQLSALEAELGDPLLELEPGCAVACGRLVLDPACSPLLNSALPREDVRSRLAQIRSGFTPRTDAVVGTHAVQ